MLGYEVDENKKLVINEREAQQVQRIFELYREHQSLLPLVQILADEGIRTQRQTIHDGSTQGGRAFTRSSLYRLITNPLYAGRVRYKDETNPGEHRAILTPEEWDATQRIRNRNGKTSGSGVRTSVGAILKGLLRCKCCNSSMTPSHTKRKNKTYRYYTCLNAQKKGWETCPSKSIPAAEIERFVVDHIRCIGRDETLLHATVGEAQRQDEERIETLESEKQDRERERTRLGQEFRKLSQQHAGDEAKLMRLWGDRQETLKRIENRLIALRQEMSETRKQLVSEDETREVLQSFDPVWESLTSGEQGRILGLLIERVEYDGSTGKLTIAFHRSGIRTLADEIANEQNQINHKEKRA